MKSLIKTLLAALLACGTLIFAACSGDEVSDINSRWDMDLPDIDIEYIYEDVGWFGDGVYYYVGVAEKDGLGVTFTEGASSQVEQIFTYNSALLANIESAYLADYSHDLSLYSKTENDGNDSLNLIYDNTADKLIILEIHT